MKVRAAYFLASMARSTMLLYEKPTKTCIKTICTRSVQFQYSMHACAICVSSFMKLNTQFIWVIINHISLEHFGQKSLSIVFFKLKLNCKYIFLVNTWKIFNILLILHSTAMHFFCENW